MFKDVKNLDFLTTLDGLEPATDGQEHESDGSEYCHDVPVNNPADSKVRDHCNGKDDCNYYRSKNYRTQPTSICATSRRIDRRVSRGF